jgi:hypothetical protein
MFLAADPEQRVGRGYLNTLPSHGFHPELYRRLRERAFDLAVGRMLHGSPC